MYKLSTVHTVLPALAFATLILLVAQDANAGPWGSGGGIGGGFKSAFETQDLFCDLDDPRSDAIIDAETRPRTFVFRGNMVCAEVPLGTTNPSLADALDLDNADRDNNQGTGGDVGFFTLFQVELENGLRVSNEEDADLNGDETPDGTRTTWTFKVRDGARDENLLWKLVPADAATAVVFCRDPENSDNSFSPCAVNFGLEEPELRADYPARDISFSNDGMFDLANGEVFKFSTETPTGGTETPNMLFWGPCHSGTFDGNAPVKCEIELSDGTTVPTRTKGEVQGILLVDVDILPESLNVGVHYGGKHPHKDIVPVVFFGSEELSVGDIDPHSLQVNGHPVAVKRTFITDVGIPNDDYASDGFDDLVVKFKRKEFIRAVTPCTDGEVTVMFTGTLNDEDATPFEGSDTLELRKCGGPGGA